MKSLTLIFVVVTLGAVIVAVCGAALGNDQGETSVHFDFKTDNGYQRVEDIKYNNTASALSTNSKQEEKAEKAVEYRGGYSFISADGYEYTVKYKANKNGFQPYVTAHKLKETP